MSDLRQQLQELMSEWRKRVVALFPDDLTRRAELERCVSQLDALVRAASPPAPQQLRDRVHRYRPNGDVVGAPCDVCRLEPNHHLHDPFGERAPIDTDVVRGRVDGPAGPSAPPNSDDDYRGCENLAGSLTLRHLQNVNAKRAARWHKGGLTDWSALEWAGAMAGEAGEACNAAKKLKRIEDGIANINLEDGRSLTEKQNAASVVVDEVADTIIYGVLLAERVGLDIEEAVRLKFNKKSEEYGFPERLAAGGVRSAGPQEKKPVTEHCQRCDSPAPHLHPAVQFEGEVQPCPDPFHFKVTNQNPPYAFPEKAAGGAAGPQAPPPLFADWFRSRGYVWSDERECWCIAWNHRSGYDFTDLEFSPWHNSKHPTRWEAIIGHHASGSNPRMSIGCCDSEADLERTHESIRSINEPDSARGDAARVPPATPQENTYDESLNDGLGDDPARVHAALEAVGRKMGTAHSAICPKCGKDVATMRVFKYHKNRRDEWCPSAGTNMDAALLATPPPQEPS